MYKKKYLMLSFHFSSYVTAKCITSSVVTIGNNKRIMACGRDGIKAHRKKWNIAVGKQ